MVKTKKDSFLGINTGNYDSHKWVIFINFRIILSKLEIPLTPKKLEQKFCQADKDDRIDYNQFIKSLNDIIDRDNIDDIYGGWSIEVYVPREAFFKADEDNDGLISADQFKLLFSSI